VNVQVAVELMSCHSAGLSRLDKMATRTHVTACDDGAAVILVTPVSETVTLVEPLTIPLVA